eukprot:12401217-Karenia_brevis.AAC.1
MEPVGAVYDSHYGLASEFVVGEDDTTVYWKVIMEDNTLEDAWAPEDHLEVCSHDYRPRASEGAYWIWLMMKYADSFRLLLDVLEESYPPARNHFWPL